VNTGQYISGAVHIGLIGWLLVGDVFRSDPPPLQVTEVTMISGAEFDAMFAPSTAPEFAASLGSMTAPTEETPPPDLAPPPEDAPVSVPLPNDQPEELPAEQAPDLSGLAPMPQAEVQFEAPTMAPPAFESSPDIVIDENPDSAPRDVPRVAPVPMARPEMDMAIAPDVMEAAAQVEEVVEVVEEAAEQDAAPEEATTEIVTEAETPSGAPTSVPVPMTRPARAAAASTETPTPQPDTTTLNDALAEALGVPDAQAADTPSPQPVGPPLTSSELDGFRRAVSQCWNTGALSSAALRVTVVVSAEMTEDGKPVSTSLRLLEASGGEGSAVTQAYEAARRAILRCGISGYDLPQEKYAQWREIEMTFNPEQMRIK
jgi:hypothetical protein